MHTFNLYTQEWLNLHANAASWDPEESKKLHDQILILFWPCQNITQFLLCDIDTVSLGS